MKNLGVTWDFCNSAIGELKYHTRENKLEKVKKWISFLMFCNLLLQT